MCQGENEGVRDSNRATMSVLERENECTNEAECE